MHRQPPSPRLRGASIRRRLAIVATALALVAAAGCAPAPTSASGQQPAETGPLALADWEVVDLTHPLSPDSLYWPNGEPFEFERQSWGYDEEGNWYAMARFATAEHLGTHLDAPIHFAPEMWTNDQIPVRRLIGPAVVVDISARAADDPDAVLEVADLDAWQRDHGDFPEGAILLVRAGWSQHWPDWNAYYGSEDPFDTATLHFPGIGPEAAERIVDAGFVGVGIDTASIDPGADTAFRAHRVLAAASLYNLENLTGLEALPPRGALLVALPAKIEGGSGGPARVVALLPR